MNNADVPIWEKYTLTIEEASKYFRIGENKTAETCGGKPYGGLGDLERESYSDQEETV
mgnify:CR=1 FL=1